MAVSRKCLRISASNMLTLIPSKRFKRDVRRTKKQGKESYLWSQGLILRYKNKFPKKPLPNQNRPLV